MSPSWSLSDVTVISVSYNSSAVLSDMIASLPKGVRTIIVDNSGQDAEALRQLCDSTGASLLSNGANLGFGVACNTGAEAATTEFLLFQNPDTLVDPGAIEALLKTAAQYDEKTVLTPRIANSKGRPNFKRRSVLLPRSEWLPSGWPASEQEVPVVSGAAIFVRRSLFQDIAFDPNIFMYHEDDDWSLRIRAAGGRLIFVPEAHMSHRSGHSSGRNPDIARFKAFQLAKSKSYALKKHNVRLPRARTIVEAYVQMLNPVNLFNARRRARCLGFLHGALHPEKSYASPKDLVNRRPQ